MLFSKLDMNDIFKKIRIQDLASNLPKVSQNKDELIVYNKKISKHFVFLLIWEKIYKRSSKKIFFLKNNFGL
ncbi:MAG: hypothetical protein EAZ07_00545 [Cytophagales bacterium]|nr:MAG: hypothetical protein EAZ07_00545 [Cytophagales bacterium]